MSSLNGSGDSPSLGRRPLAYNPESATVGADVAELQAALLGLGYQLSVDDIYGPTTADQVRRFQEDRQLCRDGVFGAVTFLELSRVRDTVAQQVTRHDRRDRWR